MKNFSERDVPRFWSKIDKTADGCWAWTGHINRPGYGTLSVGGRGGSIHLAHRISYYLSTGVDPFGLAVCHRCDNPPCVNPSHLFLGTTADNTKDMWSKGRARPGRSVGENNGSAKITAETAEQIRSARGKVRDLAAHFGISKSQVSNIKRRQNWAA